MTVNIPSLKAKLLNLAKEKNVELQVLLDRFGAEQFLARLSQSAVANQFIFKGGSLLVYLIETNRKTRDIDFSIKEQVGIKYAQEIFPVIDLAQQ